MKLQFVVIAGVAVGYGHLGRCIALADCASRMQVSSSFLLYGDVDAQRRVDQSGYACEMRPLSALVGFNDSFTDENQEVSVSAVVADIVHPMVTRNVENSRQLLQRFGALSRNIAIFDTMGDSALSLTIPALPVQFVIVPYVGAKAVVGAPWRTLAGPEYAVMGPAYANLPSRIVRKEADRVLLTCGGSDPTKLTVRALKGLSRINRHLSIRVIIGPLFAPELTATINTIACESHHEIALIYAPESIANHIFWSDLAIAASGLTKYELASCATPSILMSIDSRHDEANRPFVESSGMWDLGVDASIQSIECAVSELLVNYAARSKIAEASLRLVDGKGAQRIIANIIKDAKCC